MAKKRAKKRAKKAEGGKATEFEQLVVASCLASQLARNEYSVEACLASLETDIAAWRKLAQAAARAMRA